MAPLPAMGSRLPTGGETPGVQQGDAVDSEAEAEYALDFGASRVPKVSSSAAAKPGNLSR
jgi:hypothetical protein